MSRRPNENKLSVGVNTNVGLERKENQDSYGYVLNKEHKLLVVCDGMGGYEGGEIASQIATETIIQEVLAYPSPQDIEAMLEHAIVCAHHEVMNAAIREPELSGMGTTCVVAYFDRNTAHIANVGDSQALLVREGRGQRISKDHTSVQELLDAGDITQEEALEHPNRGRLTQALGPETMPDPRPFYTTYLLKRDDRILLASDGVTECMSDEAVGELIGGGFTPIEAANRAIDYALEHDGTDNATALVAFWDHEHVVDVPSAVPIPPSATSSGKFIAIAVAAALFSLVAGIGLGYILKPTPKVEAEPPSKLAKDEPAAKNKKKKPEQTQADCECESADKKRVEGARAEKNCKDKVQVMFKKRSKLSRKDIELKLNGKVLDFDTPTVLASDATVEISLVGKTKSKSPTGDSLSKTEQKKSPEVKKNKSKQITETNNPKPASDSKRPETEPEKFGTTGSE